MTTTLLSLAVALALALALLGCSARIPAHGQLAAVEIRGPVDSRIARDYLAGRPLPTELAHVRARTLASGAVPAREELARVARDYSSDVATLLFVESVAAQPDNRALRREFLDEVAALRGQALAGMEVDDADDLVVLFVPGWFYRAHADETGADFRSQRELLARLGVASELVPTDENGSVELNAHAVAHAVRVHGEAGRRILLVSASKSGGEVALALGRLLTTKETSTVLAWLSIGGVVQGSPLADRMLAPDLCWIAKLQLQREGFGLEGLLSMQTDTGRRAFAELEFPAHVLLVAYVATPMSSQISRRGSFGYARMRKHGPNDGLTLLADELLPGGLALVEPGFDHFFVGSDLDLRAVALLRVLLRRSMQ